MGPKPLKIGEVIYDMDNQTLGQIKHLGEQALTIKVWLHTYENLAYKTNKYVGVTYKNACRAITGKDFKQRTTILGPSETTHIDPSKWKISGKPLNKITCKIWAKLSQVKVPKPARIKQCLRFHTGLLWRVSTLLPPHCPSCCGEVWRAQIQPSTSCVGPWAGPFACNRQRKSDGATVPSQPTINIANLSMQINTAGLQGKRGGKLQWG
jgi:hypothetical protein